MGQHGCIRRPRPNPHRSGVKAWVAAWFLGVVAVPASLSGQEPTLANLSLQELAEVQIVSLSKREESSWQAAAAVSVLSGEDLRRAGVQSLPEALRLAPGVNVAQINSQRYAISIRGFNNEFADKLLVLQDGRSLYTPQFGGTFWDAQDTMLEDVDRIEVIRGPGGATWGINAMNGVINVLTKDARDTQGLLVTGGGGSFERGFGGIRQGGRLGEATYYRVYAKAFYRGETLWPDGTGAGDDWYQGRMGFRIDSDLSDRDHLTVQGDGYGGELLQYSGGAPESFVSSGGNLLARWSHRFSEESEVSVQMYYDLVRRDSLPATADTDTWDVEARHGFALGSRQELQWGVHYRYLVNRAEGSASHSYDPMERALEVGGLFVEDQISIIPGRFRGSAGAKLEYHTFSGWELLPNARLCYTPSDRHTLWTAVSRGLKSPSIADHDLTHNIPLPGGGNFTSVPAEDRPSSEVIAYEMGLRTHPLEPLTLDLACFFNDYDELNTIESTFTPSPPTIVAIPSNAMYGEVYGFETALTWLPTDWWRWRANYTLLIMQLHVEPQSTDTSSEGQEHRSPQHQVMLGSSINLGDRWELDAIGRYVSALEQMGVDAYFSLDLRVSYRILRDVELAVVGQNLLDAQHPEYGLSPGFPQRSEIPRGVYAKLTWTF